MKNMFTFCLIVFGLSACVMTEELDSVVPNAEIASALVTNDDSLETRTIPQSEYSHVFVDFINRMPDLHIKVKSIQLCNVHLSGTYHFPTTCHRGYWIPDTIQSSLVISTVSFEAVPDDSLHLSSDEGIAFIPQSIKAWVPTVHPEQSDGSYILLKCQIKQNNTPLLSCDDDGYADIAVPFTVHFRKGKDHILEIVLEHGCPWYDISGTTPSRILNPITFGVSVEDWSSVTACSQE